MNDRQRKALAVLVRLAAAGRDVRSAELGEFLGISRESVYQLLQPLVRKGILVAGRGRSGGYRAAAGADQLPASAVIAPFASASGERVARDGGPPWLLELELRASTAASRVYEAVRVTDLVEAARRAHDAPDWQI